MADLTNYLEMIETWRTRVREQTAEAQSLADALAREGEYLSRRHQADLISALRARVRQDVEATLLAEDEALSDFRQRNVRKALVHRVAGPVLAFLTRNELYLEHNARLAEAELARSSPFRTVAVQIANPGIPDGVSIVSLSQLARESATAEALIRARLEAKGARFLTPAVFYHLLDSLQPDVMKGSVVLPLTSEQLGAYLASNAPSVKRICLPAPTAIAPPLRPKPLSAGQTTHGTSSDAPSPIMVSKTGIMSNSSTRNRPRDY